MPGNAKDTSTVSPESIYPDVCLAWCVDRVRLVAFLYARRNQVLYLASDRPFVYGFQHDYQWDCRDASFSKYDGDSTEI